MNATPDVEGHSVHGDDFLINSFCFYSVLSDHFECPLFQNIFIIPDSFLIKHGFFSSERSL